MLQIPKKDSNKWLIRVVWCFKNMDTILTKLSVMGKEEPTMEWRPEMSMKVWPCESRKKKIEKPEKETK